MVTKKSTKKKKKKATTVKAQSKKFADWVKKETTLPNEVYGL